MNWNSFSRSLGFAAVSAALALLLLALLAPLVGSAVAARLCLVLVTMSYVAGLARGVAGALASAAVLGLFGAGLLALGPTLEEMAVALAGLLGIARSGFLRSARPPRALLVEAMLLITGLALAGHLLGASHLSFALALWGFFLVQSCFFLVPGMTPFSVEGERGDPFEQAYARANSLLEEDRLG
jgi:hypothetical protein